MALEEVPSAELSLPTSFPAVPLQVSVTEHEALQVACIRALDVVQTLRFARLRVWEDLEATSLPDFLASAELNH